MTAEERREFAIKSVRETRGDNYERAKMAFSGLPEEQMAKEYGESGKTRAEILAQYKRHTDNCAETIAWLESL